VANALKDLGYDNVRRIVSIGALIGMVSSLLVFQYGQARVWFAMSRDRLMPKAFSEVHPKYKTPHISTWVAGLFVGIPAGIWDIGTFADLSSIGTLFAFVLVAAGVLVLRKKDPHRVRRFRVPFSPVVPILSIVTCIILMMGLPLQAWFRFVVWLLIGLAIYFLWGRKNASSTWTKESPVS
jgi:APA family basic amino acid/polyamine antiporter